MADAFIVGVGITPLGKHLDQSVKQLTATAVNAAVADAGCTTRDIQAAWFANTRQGIFEGQHGIRGQVALTPEDQIAFAGRWGTIVPHPYVEPIEGHPEMIRIYDPNPLTETWHTDFSYEKRPPAISFLLARVIPEYGNRVLRAACYERWTKSVY